jgi:hypothetical protein
MRDAELQAEVALAFDAVETHPWLASNRVSSQHKYVAFMAAKAACSTIKLALHQFETPDVTVENWWDIHFDHAVPSLADHSTDAVVEMLSASDWFRFCIVRNPYDRLASAWKQKLLSNVDSGYQWLRDEIRAEFGVIAEEPIPFRAAVDYLVGNHNMAADPHWSPMTTTMRPDIVDYDAVGRFETFAKDFADILRRIGAPNDVVWMAGVVTNATPAVSLAELYDEGLAKRVYTHYEADFEAFAYVEDTWRDA